MTNCFLAGADLLEGATRSTGRGVWVRDGRIQAVLPVREAPRGARVIALPSGSLIAPGFIDVQVNGGGGVLFNDAPDAAAALAIAAAHRKLGTTSILPTLITDTPQAMQRAADAARLAAATPRGGVLGVHFEGPFLSKLRPGVHDPKFFRVPEATDLCLLEALAADRSLRVHLTLAPEHVPDAVLSRLHLGGVVLSAGHSAASFERLQTAVASGLTGITHLFNAMPPPSAREPGMVGAALSLPGLWCGVIADLVHVHPAMLRLVLAARGPARVFLVSDAMSVAGTPMDRCQFQGRDIFRRDGRLMTADGTLAGADLCLAQAVRNLVRLEVPQETALAMASAVPAAFLHLDHELGRIAPGYRADLVLLDTGLEVLGTWVDGAWQNGAWQDGAWQDGAGQDEAGQDGRGRVYE